MYIQINHEQSINHEQILPVQDETCMSQYNENWFSESETAWGHIHAN